MFCTDVGQRIISQKSVVGTKLVSAFYIAVNIYMFFASVPVFLGLTILNEDTK